jgi:predicted component of type VI protein secretion system
MLRVKIYRDGKLIRHQDFSAKDVVIGRGRDVDLQLAEVGVSRRHARLRQLEKGWEVEDLGAANGVFVTEAGGQPRRIVVEKVGPGASLHIEHYVLRLEALPDAPSANAPAPESFEENSRNFRPTQFLSMPDVLEAQLKAGEG